MQVVDVTINKPFKDSIRIQSEKHLAENLDKYTNRKITASDRRVLITQWCGNAWSSINRDSVKHCFKQLGLSVALDGEENEIVNIPKLPMYKMPDISEIEDEYYFDEDGEVSDDSDEELTVHDSTDSNEEDDSTDSNEEVLMGESDKDSDTDTD